MKFLARSNNYVSIQHGIKYVSLTFNWDIKNIFNRPDLWWFIKSYKHVTFKGLGFYIQIEF